MPLLFSRNKLIKRGFDLLFSSIMGILFAVLILPWASVWIVLDSQGPVFFRQQRTGRQGKVFYCYKLRTMYPNPDADKLSVMNNDRRITRPGKWFRSLFIDELPQLYNVFTGDMSLVGPRPHMLKHDSDYAQLLKDYTQRQIVKPGITGLAQIRGWHGTVEDVNHLKMRLASDLEYIRKWSMLLDLRIICATIKVLFKKKPFQSEPC